MPDQHETPPELEELLRRADNAFGTLRTSLMRAYEMPVPEFTGPSPEELAEAARDPKAGPELRAVDALVRKKKFTWSDVLDGRVDDVAEVRALQEFGKRRLTKIMVDGPQDPPEEAPDEPVEQEPRKRRRGDDEDGGSLMHDAW